MISPSDILLLFYLLLFDSFTFNHISLSLWSSYSSSRPSIYHCHFTHQVLCVVTLTLTLPNFVHQVLCVVACFAGSAALHALPVYMSTFHAEETRMMGCFFLGMGGLVIFEQVFFALVGWADKTGKKISVKKSSVPYSTNHQSSFTQLQEKMNSSVGNHSVVVNNNNSSSNNNNLAGVKKDTVEDSPLIMTASALAAAAAAALTTGNNKNSQVAPPRTHK